MIDTNLRKKIQPKFDKIAKILIKVKITPLQITVSALIIGFISAYSYYSNMEFLAVLFLWFSGLLDVLDGTTARLTSTQSIWGAFIDILFDRLVELSLILAIALKLPSSRLALIVLLASILISMCVFFMTGMLVENNSKKSFRYQAGLMERTEGFIAFSLIMLIESYTVELIYIFAILIFVTIMQRIFDAKRHLK